MIRRKEHKLRGHLCRLPFDVRPRNVKLNLSIVNTCTCVLLSQAPGLGDWPYFTVPKTFITAITGLLIV